MRGYLQRLKLISFVAFAVLCISLFIGKPRGEEALAGFLFALPNLLLLLVPASRPSIARGIALTQSFAFAGLSAGSMLLGLTLRSVTPGLFLSVPILVSQVLLFRHAAQREPSEAAAAGGPGNGSVLFAALLTAIYLLYVYEFVLRR